MIEGIPADWRGALADAIGDPSFERLADFLTMERARTDTAIYPPASQVFEALRLTPLESVRAVILGQDPCYGEGQAHGLAFSEPAGVPIPPSLRNIRAEWRADMKYLLPTGGCLEPWARHGVLLLNSVLTARRGDANGHRDHGWEAFTDAVTRAVSAKHDPVAFLLWGRPAQRKRDLIDVYRHVLIESSHPSPLSATRGSMPFLGSKPFGTVNTRLRGLKQSEIDWSLTADS